MKQKTIIFELQAQMCRVLGHPLRLRIINTLKDGKRKPVNQMVAILGEAQPTVSRHLAALRSAGILETHRKGNEIFYKITSPKVVEVCELMRVVLREQEAQHAKIFNMFQK